MNEKISAYFKKLESRTQRGKKGAPHARNVLKKAWEEYSRYEKMFLQHSDNLADNLAEWKKKQAQKECRRKDIAKFLDSVDIEQLYVRGVNNRIVILYEARKYYQKLKNHPVFEMWTKSLKIKGKAISMGLLPEERQNWDENGCGNGITISLYGYKNGLALMQIREAGRLYKKGHLNVKNRYIVTDGKEAVKVPARLVEKSIDINSSITMPLHAVADSLPEKWRQLIGEKCKLPPVPHIHIREKLSYSNSKIGVVATL